MSGPVTEMSAAGSTNGGPLPRPGLDNMNPANLPVGVQVLHEWHDNIAYVGTDSALIVGGLIRREWIANLGRATRRLVLDANGDFVIVGEGMRGTVSAMQREYGAYGIKRRHDGLLLVSCYFTSSETEARQAADRERKQAESEREAWIRTKAAHSVTDFAARWKSGVLTRLDEITAFFEGRLRFDKFPDIKVSSQEREAVRLAAAELRRAIAATSPKLDDAESKPVSNVIVLRRDGHRLLRDMH